MFKILISFTILSFLTGCAGLGGAMLGSALEGAFIGSAIPINRKPKPAKVRCVAADSMRITYGTKGSSASRDESMRIISEHCEFGYIETNRTYYTNSADVYFACLRADGETPESPICQYVANEHEPVGFGDYNPAVDEG
jgi:hypothetical protein